MPLTALAGRDLHKGSGRLSRSPDVIGFPSLAFWLSCANSATVLTEPCQHLTTARHGHMKPVCQLSLVRGPLLPCLLPVPFPAPHNMNHLKTQSNHHPLPPPVIL